MSRRGRGKPSGGVQLFPFLDVLISTMGALIVLLHVFASQGQAEAEKVEAQRALAREEQEQDADFYRWRAEHLREAREKTQAQLADERLKLSHVEDHQRRLEEQLKQLNLAAAELEKAGASRADEREKNAAELAATKEKLAAAKAAVEAAKSRGKHQAVNYSVVPFEGRNGTQRRPVYIECSDNKIILQPEGVELTPADFIGYFGPGNPLASALRAQREYFASQAPNKQLAEEPYPLLLVRPEGVAAYYAARAALDSWGSEFGYELVGSDWDLKFPPSDARLAELTEQVVAEARVRQREYILSSPQVARRRPRPVYHAKSHGGFAQQPGTGDGPEGDGLGAWSGRGLDSRGGSGADPRHGTDSFGNSGSGGAGGPGLAGEPGYGAGGGFDGSGYGYGYGSGGGLSEFAPQGTGAGGDPYSEPGEIGPHIVGRNGSRAADGFDRYGNPRGAAGEYEPGLGGSGNSGDYSRQGPYSSSLGANPGVGRRGLTSSGAAQGRGAQGGGPGGGQSANGQHQAGTYAGQHGGSQQPGGANADASQTAPGMASSGSPGSASSSGSASSPGSAMSSSASPDSAQDVNGVPSVLIGSQGHPHAPKAGSSQNLPQSMAATRGSGWGLSQSSSRAIGASRPILVQCYANRLVIVPEARGEKPREIMLGARTQDSMDELVSGVWDHTKSWGTAGRGVFWKPTLVLDVAPGADVRFQEIQALLDGSGLDVERRGQNQAKQPPASKPSRK